jgi:hypothetical protein
MAPDLENEDWPSIAERASKDTDSAKLAILIKQLCDVLDRAQSSGQSPGWLTAFKESRARTSVI